MRAAASSIASGIPWSLRADRRHGRGVLVGDREAGANGDRPLDEETDRRVLTQRDQVDRPIPAATRHPLHARFLTGVRRCRQAGDLVLLLTRDVQDRSARHDRLDLRRGPQQVGHDRCRRDDLLEVVEDEEEALVAQPVAERFVRSGGPVLSATPRALAMRGATSIGSRIGSSGTKKTPSGKSSDDRAASWSESRVLPVPPGPVSVSSRVPASSRGGRLELRVATDEGRQLGRQVVRPGIQRPERAGSRTAGRRR